MANALYTSGKQALLTGALDWVNDTIKVALVDTDDYAVNLAAHDNFDDVPAAARVASVALANKTAVGGVADADDSVFVDATGDESEALVIYKDTGVESTSTLIAYIDTATGLPAIPNGGDLTVQWDNGASKIFKV